LKTEWFNNSLLQRSPEVCEKWTLTRQLESWIDCRVLYRNLGKLDGQRWVG
jgi:hypothetical protein